jgi:hypothetical protein
MPDAPHEKLKAPLQSPQSTPPPHPSPTLPQYWPAGVLQIVGLHAPESSPAPQTFLIPLPPQVNPGWVHAPQSMVLPQLSPIRPQYWPPGGTQLVTHEASKLPSPNSVQKAPLTTSTRQKSPGPHFVPEVQHNSPWLPQ